METEKAEEQLSSCVDSEVLELYQQARQQALYQTLNCKLSYISALWAPHAKVCSADLRVKQLRDEVPAALTKAIQDHLVACRPAALEAALISVGQAAGVAKLADGGK